MILFSAGLDGPKRLALSVLLISVSLNSPLYMPWVSYVVFSWHCNVLLCKQWTINSEFKKKKKKKNSKDSDLQIQQCAASEFELSTPPCRDVFIGQP